jgi:hypothetical protein
MVSSIILNSCSPKVATNLFRTYQPIDYRQKLVVFEVGTKRPQNSEVIGSVRIGENGIKPDCNYDYVLGLAKIEARKAGGNALRIIQHTSPSKKGKACHKINAEILKIDNFRNLQSVKSETNIIQSNILSDEAIHEGISEKKEKSNDYVTLYIYSPNVSGFLVPYDLHLNKSLLCKVKGNYKKKIKVRIAGECKLWARTEATSELFVNLLPGKEYYIRCGVQLGVGIGRPSISLVEKSVGVSEFDKIKKRKNEKDILYRTKGDKIYCKIISEDNDKVIFIIETNGNEMQTFLDKSKIAKIDYAQ